MVGLELTCGDPALTPSLTAEGGSMEELLFRWGGRGMAMTKRRKML